MLVNREALRGIYLSFKTIFNKVFAETTPKYEKVATKVPSSAREENYGWLGSLPRMREWIGERVIKNLSASEYTIKNKDFEATVSVPRNDIEDDRVGIYKPAVEELGMSAATFPDDLVFSLFHKGFTSSCYDGTPFFGTQHKVGNKMISNKGTGKLNSDNYGIARTTIMSQKNEEGGSLKLMPNLLVVPPALEAEGLRILKSELINGSTNIYKDSAELFVVPELAGNDTEWFLLDVSRPLKPLIFQERKAPKLISKVSDTDDNVFYDKEYVYGVDARGNAGYGFWQMAYGSTGTTS